jgi:hypothetical protein
MNAEDAAAFARYQKAWRLANKDSRREPPSHGTNYAYSGYWCRCADCTAAHAAALRLYRSRRKAAEVAP